MKKQVEQFARQFFDNLELDQRLPMYCEYEVALEMMIQVKKAERRGRRDVLSTIGKFYPTAYGGTTDARSEELTQELIELEKLKEEYSI